ncbi:MAG: hypothetical protein OEQ18_03345 [Gammaproteobacteria bacterium]|nr:hypothetical protein [Gammaproteobacteria bacterium]MDH5512395.1 hypothetical protein [Gammaproteobacteria bacterium]
MLSLGLYLPSLPVGASIVSLAPIVSGYFSNGDGINSHWVQVENTWKGPSPFSQDFSGISALEDAAVALALTSGDAGFVRSATTVMRDINAGNDWYNADWGGVYGFTDMPPLFATGDLHQQNFAGHLWGYIAVPEPGNYNFGVLIDDGFAFTIWGNNGSQTLSLDGLNHPDRWGFDSDISMEAGLYRFDLVGYNRLEAGVVNLGWWYGPTTSEFGTISQDYLYTAVPAAVPLPPAVWLFASGLAGLVGVMRSRKSARES